MRTIMRWLLAAVALSVLTALLGIGVFRGNLAQLDGAIPVAGLAAKVTVAHDAYGTPDLARALGHIHGQERYFQMDLLRLDAAVSCPLNLGRLQSRMQGSAGWTLLGAIPAKAETLDRRASVMRRESRRLRIVDPDDGLIFRANSRVVDEREWPQLTDGSYALGACQAQIADGLRARRKHTEQDIVVHCA